MRVGFHRCVNSSDSVDCIFLPDSGLIFACSGVPWMQETREIKNREVLNRSYARGAMLPPSVQSIPNRR